MQYHITHTFGYLCAKDAYSLGCTCTVLHQQLVQYIEIHKYILPIWLGGIVDPAIKQVYWKEKRERYNSIERISSRTPIDSELKHPLKVNEEHIQRYKEIYLHYLKYQRCNYKNRYLIVALLNCGCFELLQFSCMKKWDYYMPTRELKLDSGHIILDYLMKQNVCSYEIISICITIPSLEHASSLRITDDVLIDLPSNYPNICVDYLIRKYGWEEHINTTHYKFWDRMLYKTHNEYALLSYIKRYNVNDAIIESFYAQHIRRYPTVVKYLLTLDTNMVWKKYWRNLIILGEVELVAYIFESDRSLLTKSQIRKILARSKYPDVIKNYFRPFYIR